LCDADRDNDGVPNEVDACPSKPVNRPATAYGEPFGDYDHSCFVNVGDLWGLTDCLRGPTTPGTSRCTEALDSDQDGDVDLADYAEFQRNFEGF
jgi:hypothetical protein